MTEQQKDRQSPVGQAWDDVGRQFRLLGETLVSAFKTTWESEEARQHLENIQASLEQMGHDISQAAQQAVSSEEAQKVKAEAKKVAQSAQTAGQETVEEIRPQLIKAFRRIREEVDQIINQMEQKTPEPETTSPPEETA
ncbi:MAG: hypothetical protein JXM69_16090 [Anaerolineae bacterium]|nr:hypothetical protein [Anaerolineae bacterium]